MWLIKILINQFIYIINNLKNYCVETINQVKNVEKTHKQKLIKDQKPISNL
jgi:hypothetical protein